MHEQPAWSTQLHSVLGTEDSVRVHWSVKVEK